MINEEDVWKLRNNARELALMMDDEDLEEVIVALVGVKLERERMRRGP